MSHSDKSNYDGNWSNDIYDIEHHIPGWKSPTHRKAVDKFIEELDPYIKEILRPIAETLAMLDGNAFFGMGDTKNQEWYGQ